MIVKNSGQQRAVEVTTGKLVDIGASGARLLVDHPLPAGAIVTVEVAFPSAQQGISRIRFEGTVMRSRSQHEVALSFLRPGRFLRRRLEGLVLQSRESY